MKQNIKIAVIGGTGKSGKYLVKELISQQFNFKVLVRNPQRLSDVKSPLMEVLQGDVKDYKCVAHLIEDCDVVISMLGLGVPASEKSIFSQSTTNIIKAVTEYNLKKYIVITGLNVDTEMDFKSAKTKFATNWMYENYPLTTADKQKEYEILKESSINWIMVRLPVIDQTDVITQVNIDLKDCPGDHISAASLAKFLLLQLNDNTYLNESPFIANS